MNYRQWAILKRARVKRSSTRARKAIFQHSDMQPTMPKEGTQEWRVLRCLLDAEGGWINKQHFIRDMYLTQAGRAIFELQNRFHWPVEASTFTDEFKFKSYRIVQEVRTLAML